MKLSRLDRPTPCGHTGCSLKSTSSTPAPLLRSRFFCTPHSARRASARRARSMGVSGIRKDPDALVRVESTPTPFRVVFSLSKVLGGIMPNTSTAPVTAAHSFFSCTPDQAPLFTVNAGISDIDALDQMLCFLESARRIGAQVCENLEHEPGSELLYPMLDLIRLAEGVVNALNGGVHHQQSHDVMRFANLLERVGRLFDEGACMVNPRADALAAKDAADFLSWVGAERQGGVQ